MAGNVTMSLGVYVCMCVRVCVCMGDAKFLYVFLPWAVLHSGHVSSMFRLCSKHVFNMCQECIPLQIPTHASRMYQECATAFVPLQIPTQSSATTSTTHTTRKQDQVQ